MVSAVLCNVTVRNDLQLMHTQKGSKGSTFFSFLSLALQSLSCMQKINEDSSPSNILS